MKKHKVVVAALLGVVLLAAITALASAKPAKKSVSGNVSIVGVWTGDEEKSFNAVLDGFRKANPDVKVVGTDPDNPWNRLKPFGIRLDVPAVAEAPSGEVTRLLLETWRRVVEPQSR